MCCLNYEQSTYEDIRRRLPKVGSIVDTDEYGRGEVVSNNVVKEMVKIRMKADDGEEVIREASINEGLTLVSGSFEGTIDESEIKKEVEGQNDKIIKELFKTE